MQYPSLPLLLQSHRGDVGFLWLANIIECRVGVGDVQVANIVIMMRPKRVIRGLRSGSVTPTSFTLQIVDSFTYYLEAVSAGSGVMVVTVDEHHLLSDTDFTSTSY